MRFGGRKNVANVALSVLVVGEGDWLAGGAGLAKGKDIRRSISTSM